MDIRQFEGRKRDHIRLALDPSHQALGLSGLDRFRLRHEALPELDLDEVTIASRCLGSQSRTPFYVAGMTAGHEDALDINRTLALACARRGWAMGVGSQRRQVEGRRDSSIEQFAKLRSEVPGLTLFANIGLSQLSTLPLDALRALVESVGAQALAVHANALQECLQPEGTPRFRGAYDALRRVCTELGHPVILKETGCGFSEPTLERVAGIGLAAVDVSGLGGTHWGRIEGARARSYAHGSGAASELGDPMVRAQTAETFADWGESTVDSVVMAGRAFAGRATPPEVWASGGVRSGLDAAKLLALGSCQVGYAKPALEAALAGAESLDAWMARQEFELKTALFCTGSRDLAALRARHSGGGA